MGRKESDKSRCRRCQSGKGPRVGSPSERNLIIGEVHFLPGRAPTVPIFWLPPAGLSEKIKSCLLSQPAYFETTLAGLESRPVPECLHVEVTGWQRVAERPDCNTNDARGRFSEL